MFFVPYLNSIWLKPFTDFSLNYTTLYLTLPYPDLPNAVLPYPTLPYPTLPYTTLPDPTLPSLFISRGSGICLCHADES